MRYASPSGSQRTRIQRYLCPNCFLTLSVLPTFHLPYRPVRVPRLQAFFDGLAKVGSGPDPPPGQTEAGCLRRAWARFQTRVATLQEAFGQLVPSHPQGAEDLWLAIRHAKGSLEGILRFLAQTEQALPAGRLLLPAIARPIEARSFGGRARSGDGGTTPQTLWLPSRLWRAHPPARNECFAFSSQGRDGGFEPFRPHQPTPGAAPRADAAQNRPGHGRFIFARLFPSGGPPDARRLVVCLSARGLCRAASQGAPGPRGASPPHP